MKSRSPTLFGALVLACCLAAPALHAAAATDPAAVPLSKVQLPAFPVVQLPKEARKPFSEDEVAWERVYVLAGERLLPVEGRYLRRLFSVGSAGLTEQGVMAHYAREIEALGGIRLATYRKGEDAVLRQGGLEPKRAFEKMRQLDGSSMEQYLIRSARGNVWISVGVFDGGQNGSLVVVEEQPFRQSVKPLPLAGGK